MRSIGERQRRRIWALQQDVLVQAKSVTPDLNEAYGLVYRTMLHALREPQPETLTTRAWLLASFDQACADLRGPAGCSPG